MSTLFTDNFNRADGTTGANWTTGATQWNISSNQAAPNSTNSADYWNGGTLAADCWAQLTAVTNVASANYLGLSPLLDPATFNGYYLGWDTGGATFWRLDAGSPTTIGTGGFTQPSNGTVVRLERRGGTWSIYYDDVLQTTRSESTYTSGSRAWILGQGTSARADDFSAGNLPTISSATPSGTLGTSTTATIGCTTDDTTGTLYVVVDTASLAGITATQIKAGQNASSAAADAAANSAVSTTTPSAGVTGLTASTAYNYAVLQFSGGNSNILTGSFTTGSGAPDNVLAWIRA